MTTTKTTEPDRLSRVVVPKTKDTARNRCIGAAALIARAVVACEDLDGDAARENIRKAIAHLEVALAHATSDPLSTR